MIKRFLLGLALAGACQIAVAGEGIGRDEVIYLSMHFEAHDAASPGGCNQPCRMWVTASGPITEQTPQEFRIFAASHDLHGATLVLDSEGGSVAGTIELGHAVRALDMATTVGRAVPAKSADGRAGAAYSPRASCQSMCVFLMLAGTRRYVAPESALLVHQIWLTDKARGSRGYSYTADEVSLVQRDLGRLVRYTEDMGGDAALIETALQVPPWEALKRLSSDDIRRMNLSTTDRPLWRDQGQTPVAAVQAPVISASVARAAE